MKAASGEVREGGVNSMLRPPLVEGRSLEILWDLVVRGVENLGDSIRPVCMVRSGGVIVAVSSTSSEGGLVLGYFDITDSYSSIAQASLLIFQLTSEN